MSWQTAASNYFGLPDELFKQSKFALERRVLDIGIEPGWGFHYSFLMREYVEGVPAMVGADAAIAPSAKGQIQIGEMPAGIVHAAPAKRDVIEPTFFKKPVTSKNVQSKGIWVPVHDCFCFLIAAE